MYCIVLYIYESFQLRTTQTLMNLKEFRVTSVPETLTRIIQSLQYSPASRCINSDSAGRGRSIIRVTETLKNQQLNYATTNVWVHLIPMTTIMAYKSAIFVFINLFTIVYSQLQYQVFENKTECKETGNYFQYYQTSTLTCVQCPNASSVMTVSSDGKNHAQTGRININMTNLLLITTRWLFFIEGVTLR